MKKLNPSYFEFFFFRYGIIVVFIQIVSISLHIYLKEEDLVYLAIPAILCVLFLLFICSSEYRMLRKNLPPANVFLTDNSLIINEVSYSSEQIEKISYMSVRNTLNKFPDYFYEIKTIDGVYFYFLDKRMNWKGESPTMKLLNANPLFSLKTKEKEQSSKGFSAFHKQDKL
ncbi:hypothetical protein SAMN05421786_101432 [Chryseobacterium ureilyticum]|uniref:Uncharacterized protein n=1 Tax=Chryseobacterium ureilyticum TaxID=373668 RepID=A0A1N7KF80_9FLAO|nr:hypothetical protein [Chryseobacterium ureilyticum]SIS60242.1 hypothetical protein SAMN05421786_101432 [Chryseobacterium ureilyticum]